MRNTVEKLLTKATTLPQTSSQLEVCTWSNGAPKLWESQLWEFWDSHLGVLGQNAIWMWPLWRGVNSTRRGKVMASPKSGWHISFTRSKIIFNMLFFCFGIKLYMVHATNSTTIVIMEFTKAQCSLAITSLIIKLEKHFTTYKSF
jgi:hypothetical protein